MLPIVIIGGGPAGSACAIALAGAGLAVTILEAREFPRPKVCGEYISPRATALLQELLPADQLTSRGATRVNQLVLENGEQSLAWRLPRASWVLSRRALDTALLQAAAAAGAAVAQPARVHHAQYSHAHASIYSMPAAKTDRRVCHAQTSAFEHVLHRTTNAALIIHADGAGRHDPAGKTPVRRDVVALKCYLKPSAPPLRGLHLRAGAGAYLGAVGIEAGGGTIALVAKSQLLRRRRGDIDAMVANLYPNFDPAHRCGRWFSCPVADSPYIQPGHLRSFRIGNAAAAVEPVGGEGIGLALASGWKLGQLLAEFGTNEPGLQKTQAAMASWYRAQLRRRRPACRLAAAILMRPRLVQAVWPVLAATPARHAVLWPWYRLSGKPA